MFILVYIRVRQFLPLDGRRRLYFVGQLRMCACCQNKIRNIHTHTYQDDGKVDCNLNNGLFSPIETINVLSRSLPLSLHSI